MKFLNVLPLLSLVAAAANDTTPAVPVEVKIEQVGTTAFKATVQSHHTADLKLLKIGSILDESAVEKATVLSGENEIEFQGVRLYINYVNLTDSSFVNLPANGALESTFDVATYHDLSAGGEFQVDASGFIQYAEGSTEIAGVIPYESTFTIKVDGPEAKGKLSVFQDEPQVFGRAKVNRNTCKGDKLTKAKNALSLCNKNAKAAAKAARSGPERRMKEYFKSATSATRKTVAGVFDAIAKECSTNNSGRISFSCANTNFCKSNPGVVAYASGMNTVFCPAWYSQPVNGACHQGDRASVILHEFSHSLKGTQDFNAYGYAALRRLPASKNIKHADSYTYFSNAVEVNC
ncbi:unnamed protein product [Clonostachys byssicola]|uniref:Neutral protease 2 n=1 Tax=Clonostachys byssicola TaxID=160290 RepID=A0A9N9UD61_9HYPO|nr:unnamed protein product [Clonostachys byssicola]